MKGAEDPARLALSHALGSLQDAGRLLKRAPDTTAMVERLRVLCKEIGARLDGMPLQEILALPEAKEERAPSWLSVELEWREGETWQAHLRAWKEWKRRQIGVTPNGREPFFHPTDIRDPIRQALRAYDQDLLPAERRDAWKRDSRVRAAGIGIFYSRFHTGDFEDGTKPNHWAGPYLEHWRPWKRQKGKADPIIQFSDLYFEARQLAEGESV